MISATVIAHSISPVGKEIVTFQLKYQRFIHAEFMTHRVFSRNSMSSRAVPVAKMIEQVRNDPAMPVHWGANQPGMQANKQLEGPALEETQETWRKAARMAAEYAEIMSAHGAHKQVANRILEPFQWMHTIVTATEWDNFFELRNHPDAQPEFRALAIAMAEALRASTPELRAYTWHLPYVTQQEREQYVDTTLLKLSAARCARVSYLKHDGTAPSCQEDMALFDRLVGSRPLHASPIEHQARPALTADYISNNFRGWQQYRAQYVHEKA